MITIPVSGGTGSVSFNFGNLKGEALSLTSPDSTPMYDFNVFNSAGNFIIGASNIDAQKTRINELFQFIGVCTLTITGAVDDGNYFVEVFQR